MNSIETNAHLKSFERVHNYPIVNDSFLFALSYYRWAKSKNTILDATFSKLEQTLTAVKEKTEPLAAERLHYVDEKLFNQLDKLEKMCPLILEPSTTIASIPANIYHQRVEPTINKVVHPVTQTVSFVFKTSSFAASIMSSTLSHVIPAGLLPLETTNKILDKTEQLLDKYLPEEEENARNDKQSSNELAYTKLKRLSKKTQRRLYKKVIHEIVHFKEISLEKLEQIKNIIREIKQRKSSDSKDSTSEQKDNSCYKQLIQDGIHYLDSLQQIVLSKTKSIPIILCTGSISIMDLLNEKLFTIRNTIIESSNQSIVSEKRLNQAADAIDLVRSWIEYMTDNLQEYYNRFERKSKKEVDLYPEVDDLAESSSDGHSSDDEDDSNEQ